MSTTGAHLFSQIVDEYKQKIYYLALDLTGNHHDAEDLSQEVFVAAFRAIDRFRGDAKPGTWLYRITVNTHINRTRKKSFALAKQHDSLEDENSHVQPLRDLQPDNNPETSLEASDIQSDIDRALEVLTAQERAIFVLRHYEHLKLREIAEVLDRSEGTVKATLFRAVRKLRNELSAHWPSCSTENLS